MLGISAHFPQLYQKKGSSVCGKPYDRSREEWLQKKYAPETIGERYEELIKKCGENHIRIAAMSAPDIPDEESQGKEYVLFLRTCAVESIKLCRKAGCSYLIVPPQWTENGNGWERNKEFYLMLAETAKEYNVHILLRNQGEKFGGRLVRGIVRNHFRQWSG